MYTQQKIGKGKALLKLNRVDEANKCFETANKIRSTTSTTTTASATTATAKK